MKLNFIESVILVHKASQAVKEIKEAIHGSKASTDTVKKGISLIKEGLELIISVCPEFKGLANTIITKLKGILK